MAKKEHSGTSKTRKQAVSRKLETYFVPQMIVTENLDGGKVHVRYICTHQIMSYIGLQECRYLPLPHSIKRDIQPFAADESLERVGSNIIQISEVALCLHI